MSSIAASSPSTYLERPSSAAPSPKEKGVELNDSQMERLNALLDFPNQYQATLSSGTLKFRFSFRAYLDSCLEAFKKAGIPIRGYALKGGAVHCIRKEQSTDDLADIDLEFYLDPSFDGWNRDGWGQVEEILLSQLLQTAGSKALPSLPNQRHFLTQSGGLCESFLLLPQFSLHSIPLFRQGKLQPLEINVIFNLPTPCFSSHDARRIQRNEAGTWEFTTVGPYSLAESMKLSNRDEFAIQSEEWANRCQNGWFRYLLLLTQGLRPVSPVMASWIRFNERISFQELNKMLDKHFFHDPQKGLLFLFNLVALFGFKEPLRPQRSASAKNAYQNFYWGRGVNEVLRIFLGIADSHPDVMKLANLYLFFTQREKFSPPPSLLDSVNPWILSTAPPFDHPGLQRLVELFPLEGQENNLRRFLRKQVGAISPQTQTATPASAAPPVSARQRIEELLSKRQFSRAVDVFCSAEGLDRGEFGREVYEVLLRSNNRFLALKLFEYFAVSGNDLQPFLKELAAAYWAALGEKGSLQNLQDALACWKLVFSHLTVEREDFEKFLKKAIQYPSLQKQVFSLLLEQKGERALFCSLFTESYESKKIEAEEMTAQAVQMVKKMGPSFLLALPSALFKSVCLSLKGSCEEEALLLLEGVSEEVCKLPLSRFLDFFSQIVRIYLPFSDQRAKEVLDKGLKKLERKKELGETALKLLSLLSNYPHLLQHYPQLQSMRLPRSEDLVPASSPSVQVKGRESSSDSPAVSSPKDKPKKTVRYFQNRKKAFEQMNAEDPGALKLLEELVKIDENDSEVNEALGFLYFLKGKSASHPEFSELFQKSIEYFGNGYEPLIQSAPTLLKWKCFFGLANSRYYLFIRSAKAHSLSNSSLIEMKETLLMPAIQGFKKSLPLLEQCGLPEKEKLVALAVSYRTFGDSLKDLYKIEKKVHQLKDAIEALEKAFRYPVIYTTASGLRKLSTEVPDSLILALRQLAEHEGAQENKKAEQKALKRIEAIEKQMRALASYKDGE